MTLVEAAPVDARGPAWRLGLVVLRRAAVNFHDNRGTHAAAAIAYYALFTLFPLTALAVSIFGIVLRDAARRQQVLDALLQALPVEAPEIVAALHAVADRGPLVTGIALIATVWSASALFGAVGRSVGAAFDGGNGRPLLHGKAIDVLMLSLLGTTFLASVALTTAWRILEQDVHLRVPLLDHPLGWLWNLGAVTIPALLTFAGLMLLYWLAPSPRRHPRHLLGGAALATVGFEAVKLGFASYVAHVPYFDFVYGSLGGLMVLLLWVYVSANVLLYGAEVAAETAHVLVDEPRHRQREPSGARWHWRPALRAFLRGLVLHPRKSAPAPQRRED